MKLWLAIWMAVLLTACSSNDGAGFVGHLKTVEYFRVFDIRTDASNDTMAAAAAPGTPACDGASWTATANPQVSGSDNVSVVACLFPYKGGYHLDMYTAFTRPDGGWMHYPRRWTGVVFGTPEKWTERTMLDVVRAIQARTSAQVVVVEAKPGIVGTPWIDPPTGGL